MVHKLRSSAPAIRVDSDQMTSRPDLFTLTVQKECRNHRLTRREEEEVISHAFSGKTDKEIARALGNSPRTVQQQLQNVYRNLGVRTRMEAVRRLLRSHDDIAARTKLTAICSAVKWESRVNNNALPHKPTNRSRPRERDHQ